jgi:hypothetical protein
LFYIYDTNSKNYINILKYQKVKYANEEKRGIRGGVGA